ncbi:MAG: c-type cytochrome [Betaproteobacteria bacterium]|nr:c-type cytochrome [Betaproteobacteria bacterium]
MSSAVGKVFGFLLLLLATFLWIGQAVTALTGGEKAAASAVEISPEGGESIFWGKGRCFTCHSMGDRGSAVRGPNQGVFGENFPLPIGARAAERAKERSQKTGQTYTATDYLVESLAEPGAYVVEGYKNEMAIVYAPPIALNLKEVKAVIAYLQSQGGELDLESLEKPNEVSKKFFAKMAAAQAAGGGDPSAGEQVYASNCASCHVIKGKGGKIGPELSSVAGKGAKYIEDSILRPAKSITPGFETWTLTDKAGRKTIGLKTADTASEVEITKANGEKVRVAKADIKELDQDKDASVMPDNLNEAMTVKDLQDVLAYMMLQKSE